MHGIDRSVPLFFTHMSSLFPLFLLQHARLDTLSTELYQVNVYVSHIVRRQATMGNFAPEPTPSPPHPVASDSDAENDDDDDGDDDDASDDDGDASSTDEMST